MAGFLGGKSRYFALTRIQVVWQALARISRNRENPYMKDK